MVGTMQRKSKNGNYSGEDASCFFGAKKEKTVRTKEEKRLLVFVNEQDIEKK